MADRYPFAPLEALVLVDVGPRIHDSGQDVGRARLVAEVLGVDRRQVIRWRDVGVTADQADRLAVAAKRHPFEVWPELAGYHNERRRTYQRRWRRTRRGRASHRRSKAKWRASTGDYQTRYNRQWRAANPDRKREQDRRYWQRHGHERNEARRTRYHSDAEYRAQVLERQRERDRAKAAARRAELDVAA